MHAIEVLDEVRRRMSVSEEITLRDVLLELETKVRNIYTDDNLAYGHLAELESIAYTAQQLYRESQGDSIYHMPAWPDNDLLTWRNKCLSPFLETVSNRLQALTEEFRVLLFEEWPEPREPHEPTAKEIAQEKQTDFDFVQYLFSTAAGKFPGIRDELDEILTRVKPEGPEAEGIDSEPATEEQE